MTQHRRRSVYVPPSDPQYRVLVKARPDSRSKEFIWQIVRDSAEGLSVKDTSAACFKTMGEAYIAGTAALNKLLQ